MTLQVQLTKDERYPDYGADIMDGTYPPWGVGIVWPEEHSYDEYTKACWNYREWQGILAKLYKENEDKQHQSTTWSTTNLSLQTPTSSTPTS